jgi:hypothetical protein
MGDAADLIDDVLETVFTFFSPLLRGGRGVLESAHVDKVDVF